MDDNNRFLLEELSRQHSERVQMVHEDRYTNELANEKHQIATRKVFNVLLCRFFVELAILVVLVLMLAGE